MATAETARLIASLELQDKNFTRGLKQVERGVGRVDKKLGAFSGAINRNVGRAVDNVTARLMDVPGQVIAAAVEQESAITGIAKTVEGNIDGIVDDLKRLSTQTGSTFTELAGIAELGGAMGIAKDDLAAFTEQVAILGATTNVSVEDAATALGVLGNVIGLTGDEFDNFSASLVDLGNKGESTEAAILEIAKRSGGAANLFGIAKDETLAWSAAVANLGLNEEVAGTALQNLFLKAMPAFLKGNKTLQKVTGKTAKELKQAFEKDASGALQGFIQDLSELSEGDRLAAIQKMFGKGSGLTRVLLGLTGDTDNLTDSLEIGTKAWEEATAAQAEAEKRFGTSEFAFKRLNNAVNLLAAGVGKELLPVLVDLAEQGIEVLTKPETQRAIKEFATGLGKGIRSLAGIITSINWGAVAGFLSTAAGFAGQLVTWFTKMPDWAQAFLIGSFAVTKLPVIGDLVSELGKGLIKGVLGMTAGVVNINAGVVNGGGVPGLPGAKGGGGQGIFSKILTGITGLGISVAGGLTIAAIAPIAAIELARFIGGGTEEILKDYVVSRRETATRRGVPVANQPTDPNRRVPAQGLQGDWLKDWTKRNANLQGAIEDSGAPGAFRPKAPSKEGGAPGAFRPVVAAINKSNVALSGIKTGVAAQTTKTNVALSGIKTGIAADKAATTAELTNLKSTTAAGLAQQRAALIAQTAVNAAGNMLSVFQSASQVLAAQGTTTAANNTTVAARGAGNQTSSAMSAAASRIVSAVNALDLSVNVTTVNRTSTVNNRYGPSGGSSTTERAGGNTG